MENSNSDLPDWVTGELGGHADDSLTVGLLKDRTSTTQVAAHQRYLSTIFHLGVKCNLNIYLKNRCYFLSLQDTALENFFDVLQNQMQT